MRMILVNIIAEKPALPRRDTRMSKSLCRSLMLAATAALSTSLAGPLFAQEAVVNLYSARHYQTDDALYAGFTKRTGIRINRIEGTEDALLERLNNEGANSPADVLITVDVARLWRAQRMSLFQPVASSVLDQRIPAHLREPGGHWFGFSKRARVIVYNKRLVSPDQVRDYQDLARPHLKGRVCTRSLSHVYNLSLMAALVDHLGQEKAQQWARGLKANLARDPKGGDTDQIRSVAAGECEVGIANTYYYVRLAASEKQRDRNVAEKVGLVFPNQKSFGTHINISGAGVMRHAPHRENAIRFLEYLASPEAQTHFANGNNEWPAVRGAKLDNPALARLGNFREDELNVGKLGQNQPLAQKIFNIVGLK